MRLWRDYSLSITLASLWILSWTIQTGSGWMEYRSEQAEHGQVADLGGYLWVWLRTTFENNASEFLQLFSMVVLTSFLVHRGSGEGKQQQEQADRMEAKVDAALEQVQRIQRHLTRLSTADHPFEPLIPGDTSELAMCVMPACLLRRRQHPHPEGTL